MRRRGQEQLRGWLESDFSVLQDRDATSNFNDSSPAILFLATDSIFARYPTISSRKLSDSLGGSDLDLTRQNIWIRRRHLMSGSMIYDGRQSKARPGATFAGAALGSGAASPFAPRRGRVLL